MSIPSIKFIFSTLKNPLSEGSALIVVSLIGFNFYRTLFGNDLETVLRCFNGIILFFPRVSYCENIPSYLIAILNGVSYIPSSYAIEKFWRILSFSRSFLYGSKNYNIFSWDKTLFGETKILFLYSCFLYI